MLPDDLLGVGIEEELVGVEAVPGRGLVGAVHPVAVDRAGPRVRQIAVPDLVGVFRQLDALEFALASLIEQAELHLGGVGREQGEVDAEPVPCRAKRIGTPLEDAGLGA